MHWQISTGIITLTLIVGIISCKNNAPAVEDQLLELVDEYFINIEEPSGLALANDNSSLWVVSDKHSKIYQLDLTGQTLQEIAIPGIGLEGITVGLSGHSFWVVQESLGELLNVDTLGNEIQRIDIAGAKNGSGGLEGITINSINNHIFLIKEKDPSILIELNTDFETILFRHLSTATDYSGIDYDEFNNKLWLVSDQEKMIYRCEINGATLNSYPIHVNKAEGIAFDVVNNLIYIVSDSAESLYIFKLK